MRGRLAEEQFFFDQPTTQWLLQRAHRCQQPLFLCTPSLAVAYEKMGLSYLLLDRDRRFSSLGGYRYFDLCRPEVWLEPFDGVFFDPPFGNLTVEQICQAWRLMNGFSGCTRLLLFHLKKNENKIKNLLPDLGMTRSTIQVGYQSLSRETCTRIGLFLSQDASTL